ncbi:bifunctional RNase H/acid phosphatase [Streptomyces sp. SL13]|uniref:Bifunctional RNase H/acid phosphatase n=1 Tax=Streptantibioticus silvisoli TaxID=2705255 RepID=A0AA90GUA8_9ACTN|nr:bifunctional RNase H/acid phosphatase [Streptantibioticus silvisoli]MDI5968163.1 bifunctional RNase H/acid phosphatase [Streptantibioticus silvisoli]
MTGRLLVEADGGSRGNPGPAGYGAVVKDAATGETLLEEAGFIGTATNNVAEYRGLIAGLRAARRLDPGAEVLVRMDSKLVVEQMSDRWRIKHPGMRPLAAEARAVFPPGQVTYEWMPRERNKHADRLANEAMDAGQRGERWQPADSTAQFASGGEAADGAGAFSGEGSSGAGEVASGEVADGAGESSGEAADVAGEVADGAVASGAGAVADGASASGEAPGVAGAVADAPGAGVTTTFVLLRHGETALTPERRFSGSGGADDPELSDKGRWQARRAAEALAARGTIEAVVCSPLARCRATAAIVADRLGLPVEVEPELREADFGAWEGLSFAEVRERHPADLAAWLASPDVRPTGGGESLTMVASRIAAAQEELTARQAGRTVLLVTHLTPVKTLVRLALGAPAEALFRMDLSAASLSVVARRPDGTMTLRLFNDTSYLRG